MQAIRNLLPAAAGGQPQQPGSQQSSLLADWQSCERPRAAAGRIRSRRAPLRQQRGGAPRWRRTAARRAAPRRASAALTRRDGATAAPTLQLARLTRRGWAAAPAARRPRARRRRTHPTPITTPTRAPADSHQSDVEAGGMAGVSGRAQELGGSILTFFRSGYSAVSDGISNAQVPTLEST
jgi:hypothetical protein